MFLMRYEIWTNSPVDERLHIGLLNLNNLAIATLLITMFVFLVQNVIMSKYLDYISTDRKFHPRRPEHDRGVRFRDLRWHSNDFYLYPYAVCLVFLYALFLFRSSLKSSLVYSTNYQFELFRGLTVTPRFIIDNVNVGFLLTTLTIGLAVNMIWHYYMLWEANQRRFHNLLNGFLFSMALLLLSYNLLTLLLFWEFIGLFSYFLINFWNKKPATFKSATKAMVYNQISDVFLVLGIVIYYNIYGTLTLPYSGNHQLPPMEGSPNLYRCMCISFLLAASCKSAQVPLHVWLPDSMDAPAPASALIHSATLVAAGIFLVLKMWPVLRWDITILKLFSTTSLLTVVVGGIAASIHADMKKILAYSTISNCGFMMFFALNTTTEQTVHFFMAHGYLKASSFIALSIIMSGMMHKQDYRNIGGIGSGKPFWATNATVSIGMLGALPFSIMQPLKHSLVDYSTPTTGYSELISLSINIGVITSAIYSTKLILNLFYGQKKKPYWFTYNHTWINGPFGGATRSSMHFGTHAVLFLFLLYHVRYVDGFKEVISGFSHPLHAIPTAPVINRLGVSTFVSNKLQLLLIFLVSLPIWSQRLNKRSVEVFVASSILITLSCTF